MKKYGIFIGYPPFVDFRLEGLGRYLAEFVKAAADSDRIDLVIACPSWSREALRRLLDEKDVPAEAVKFVGPERPPILFRINNVFRRASKSKRTRRARRLGAVALGLMKGQTQAALRALSSSRDIVSFVGAGAYIVLLMLLALPVMGVGAALIFGQRLLRRMEGSILRELRPRLDRALSEVGNRLGMNGNPWSPLATAIRQSLMQAMIESEATLVARSANQESDVVAWYSPSAFWPAFNEIEAPRLMCIPDVVLGAFPIGFSVVGGEGMLASYKNIVRSIEGGANYVTYSEAIKTDVLQRNFSIPAGRIRTIYHAPNDLSGKVMIRGFSDVEAASATFCRNHLAAALRKSANRGYVDSFATAGMSFIFYASQFRPSKNVVTLIRAYEYLLRRRFISHKLVLTGRPRDIPDVARLLHKSDLTNDVLCLEALSETELAACYKLADLAVNPSLAEGGMPFTFAEALSVGTPVVMGDIAVTREVLTDASLRQATLFDPYNFRAMADKIEWALQNTEALYAKQRKFYDEVLARRTWGDVVAEHIAVLDEIAETDQEIPQTHRKVAAV